MIPVYMTCSYNPCPYNAAETMYRVSIDEPDWWDTLRYVKVIDKKNVVGCNKSSLLVILEIFSQVNECARPLDHSLRSMRPIPHQKVLDALSAGDALSAVQGCLLPNAAWLTHHRLDRLGDMVLNRLVVAISMFKYLLSKVQDLGLETIDA